MLHKDNFEGVGLYSSIYCACSEGDVRCNVRLCYRHMSCVSFQQDQKQSVNLSRVSHGFTDMGTKYLKLAR
jgi:hypothetical protein